MNYKELTGIQAGVIPLILQGRDVIGKSGTGTGKTAAFGLPLVEMLRPAKPNRPLALVLSPTRELAVQICDEIRKYSKYKPSVTTATVYGGQSYDIQLRQLKVANVVIGTPGRIMDHMRRGTLVLDDLQTVVLDEADEMLNMGFLDDIKTILSSAPQQRQTLLFSATMPPEILKITKEFQNDPVFISGPKADRSPEFISQFFYRVPQGQKKEALHLLLQAHRPKRALVFCNTKSMVDELVEYLNDNGFVAIGLHGDKTQSIRNKVMGDFKADRVRILVATDVAARGIDVEEIEAVYNYDIPMEDEYYVHRIGRTGRAGKKGSAYTFACNPTQIRRIRDLERFVKSPITELPLPTTEEIQRAADIRFADKIKKAAANVDERWLLQLRRLNQEGYDTEIIACALMEILAGKERRPVPVIRFKDIPVEGYQGANKKTSAKKQGSKKWYKDSKGRENRSGYFENKKDRGAKGGNYKSRNK